MKLAKFTKTPGDRKRYVIAYQDWLDEGEVISTATYALGAVPDNIYVDGIMIGEDQKSVVLFVSGGLADEEYDLGIRIITSLDQIKEDYVTFVVKEFPVLDWSA